eukprot:TRINITY_DN4931_c0_g1_i3.p1 TRINITY_DN4931_c0_g1~~TRINITY_DN4931_c0_g1_i3.p1  ORF type:complete len:221 (+),score=33.48 TRINITY_DN4931_c0_g1_i3:78-665(+)
MEESKEMNDDQIFRLHFNRESALYHGGDPTPVPIGGQRVPVGMEEHQHWQALPEQPPVVETIDDPEYLRLSSLRENLGNLKKVVQNLCPPVELLRKLSTSVEESKTLEQKAEVERKRAEAIAAVRDVAQSINEQSADKYRRTALELSEKAETDMSAEEMQQFFALVRTTTQQIFREQSSILQQMKKVKAAARAKN